jgi:murein DD-endopeptidase MepM/ murein hydrolase activator NlpD
MAKSTAAKPVSKSLESLEKELKALRLQVRQVENGLSLNKVINVSILVGLCWGLALGAEGFYQGRRAYNALLDKLPFVDGNTEQTTATAPAELDLTPVKRGDKVAGLTVTSVYREPQRPNHNGVDVGGPVGTPYFAPALANVRCYWDRSGGGYVAEFQHRDLLWQLLHLKAGTCKAGSQQPGGKIGEMGNTGRSTGPHLHLQLRNPDGSFIEPKRGHLLAVLQPPAPTPRDGGNTSLDALRRAIIGKESGGNFKAINPHSGALGYGQIMPSNLPSWSRAAVGREVGRDEFLNSPDLQIAIINHRLGLYLQEETSKGFDHDTAIRRVASRWYSGRAHLYNNTRPQRYGSGHYPSINDYTLTVLRKYKAEKGG